MSESKLISLNEVRKDIYLKKQEKNEAFLVRLLSRINQSYLRECILNAEMEGKTKTIIFSEPWDSAIDYDDLIREKRGSISAREKILSYIDNENGRFSVNIEGYFGSTLRICLVWEDMKEDFEKHKDCYYCLMSCVGCLGLCCLLPVVIGH